MAKRGGTQKKATQKAVKKTVNKASSVKAVLKRAPKKAVKKTRTVARHTARRVLKSTRTVVQAVKKTPEKVTNLTVLLKKKKPTKDLVSLVIVLLFVFSGMLYAQGVEAPAPTSAGELAAAPAPLVPALPTEAVGKIERPYINFPPPANDPVDSVVTLPETDGVPILMYHYVRDVYRPSDALGWNLSINPADFERQLLYLQEQGFRSAHLADLADGKVRSKSIILTFDDATVDFYTTAWPLLKKYGFSASVGVITDFMGKTNHMSEEQLRELAREGVELAAHTVSHPNLLHVTLLEAEQQIRESKRVLEETFPVDVRAFIYPIGKFNKAILGFVEDAGYEIALTTAHGLAEMEIDNPFVLPRMRVDNRDGYDGFVSKFEDLLNGVIR